MSMPEGTTLTSPEILAIGTDEPERLFAHNEAEAERQWRTLSSHWHPDHNDDRQAHWVFGHVQDLYRAARNKRAVGLWDTPGLLQLAANGGKKFRLHYFNRYPFDVGTAYIARNVLAYVIDGQYADLAAHAFQLIENLPFADARMATAMNGLLPEPVRHVETPSARVLVQKKRPEYVALRNLLNAAGGSLAPRHVAWIVSSLLNLACYLEGAGLVHQAIDIDHLLVAPEFHSISLTGGWWYATAQGAPIHALPNRSVQIAPPDLLTRRIADRRLDQLLIRQTAVDLLGDALNETPSALQDFLFIPPAPTAIDDYEQWQQTLWECFGERRFVPLDITPDDIYSNVVGNP